MSLTIISNYVSVLATLFGLFGVNIAPDDLQATLRVISAIIALISQFGVHWGRFRAGGITFGGIKTLM